MSKKTNGAGEGAWVRALLVLGMVGFVGSFQWGYVNWLHPYFGFYGYDYNPPATRYLVLASVLSVLPSLWMPLTIRRPSQLAYWVLYLTVIIPSLFIPLYVGLNRPSEIASLMLMLFVGFAITGMSYLLPLLRLKRIPLSRSLFWSGLAVLAGSLMLWVAVAFRDNMHLVGFGDIYDLRVGANDVLNPWLNYALMWLYGAIDPFFVACGLYYKRTGLFVAGTLGQVLVYSCYGTKASLLSIIFIVVFYFLLRAGRVPFSLKVTWGLVALFVGLFLLDVAVEVTVEGAGGWFHFATSLVLSRTFGLPGLLTAQYYNFIHHNPLTYYSHIKIVNLFLHYPYKYPLGTEIGYYYYFPLVDTTAHFWATDGLAALGLAGIPLISVFCAFVFWMLDSVTQKHDPRLAAMVTSYAIFSLANLSIFTTLLSGGFGLLILFLYLMPPGGIRFRAAKKETERDISTASHGHTLPISG